VLEYLIIAVIVVWVLVRLQRSFLDGFILSATFLTLLPTHLRITLPEPLPALTIHRMLLLLMLAFWMRNHELRQNADNILMKRLFIFWAITGILSVIFSEITFITSLKDFLDFSFEVGIFFLLASTTVRDEAAAIRLVKALWMGFLVVAVFAAIEKYTRFNIVDAVVKSYTRTVKARPDVVSTYPHRILLGTAMAMSLPLVACLSLFDAHIRKVSKTVLFASAGVFIAACYFAMSRGPWLAAGLAAGVLFMLGTPLMKKRLMAIGMAAALAVALRPGVLSTLTGMAEETVDQDSLKGGTFRYRIELWKIAWGEVSKSPIRALVGMGLGAGREAELTFTLSYRDKEYQIESWDNHFAYNLYQSGLLGLASSLSLFAGAAYLLFRIWRRAEPEKKMCSPACFPAPLCYPL
jgi:hypothetical protein